MGLSMLYGSYNFPQLEAALDLHRRHCERWGYRFECLTQPLTARKLYSKPYFLLLTMLTELSKSMEERHEWLILFYLKINQYSLDLLTQIVDYPMAHPDIELGWSADQAAMERVIRSMEIQLKDQDRPPGIAWVPREWFNTFEFEHGFEGQPGHFIVHFPGLGETRISHMAQWLNVLQQNQQEWEISPEYTFYAEDVPRFWNEFAANASIRLA
ncbi:glycosyltransferase family 34 protein [Acidomyces richmondensis BFW]|nr:glycosyltransferase family 34 protein [Acidomyces richmondensis BFW]